MSSFGDWGITSPKQPYLLEVNPQELGDVWDNPGRVTYSRLLEFVDEADDLDKRPWLFWGPQMA